MKEVSSEIRYWKLKTNNIFFEKYKNMNKNPDNDRNYSSRTTKTIYKIGHDSIRLGNGWHFMIDITRTKVISI